MAKKPYFCKALEILRCAQDDIQFLTPPLCCACMTDRDWKKIHTLCRRPKNFLANFAMCRKFSFIEIPS